MARLTTAISAAQRGQPMIEFFAPTAPLHAELGLGLPERQRIVETFIELIEGLYVHLPLKRAMYGKDPVQRLRVLKQRAADLTEPAFHAELATIFTELRDAHTRYVGPAGLRDRVAVLPFMIEAFGPEEAPRFLVSNVSDDPVLAGSAFGAGVELLWWNGMPIGRAVDRHADRETGGRPDSRRARALESMTFRALQYGPPPDEYWVVIGYRTADGAQDEIRADWRVVDVGRVEGTEATDAGAEMAYAGDPAAEAVRRAKKLLFAPRVWLAHQQRATPAVPRARSTPVGEWITGRFQDNVAAKQVETAGGRFGYLRLWSFDLIDDDGYLAEVIELLALLPVRGLIVDLRGNPGGLIWAAERLLQLFTPYPVMPTRFSLMATNLTRVMAMAPQNEVQLEPWRRSLQSAVANGEQYSRAMPLTPPPLCNNVGQRYPGPVVAVVDANTYSAGDLFAAGFVDNRIGALISVGQATGAGGANVWFPGHVSRALAGTEYDREPLPAGVGYTVAFRRALRSGSASGTVIEDLGVPGHFRYQMTQADLTGQNADLLDFCGRLLASETVTNLVIERIDDRQRRIVTTGLDRVDLYVDDRPFGSPPLIDGVAVTSLPDAGSSLTVEGYAGEQLRQRRVVRR